MRLVQFLLMILIVVSSVSAQEGQTVLEKNKILIGEQILLTYHVTLKNDAKVTFDPYRAFIPAKRKILKSDLGSKDMTELEIMEPFADTILTVNGKKEWFGSYTITAWDSGLFIIPSTSIFIQNKRIEFPQVSLNVKLVATKNGQDIYDIRESFTEIPDEPFSLKQFHSKNWWWFYPVLIVIAGLLMFFRWKKKHIVYVKLKKLTLREKTIAEIETLEKSKLWTKDRLKEHYIELSFILRSYLSARFEINLLEKTTYESKLLLVQKGLNKQTIETIGEILDHADMVKFAKSAPEEITVLRLSVLSKQIVEETSPIEFENVE